MMIPLSIERKAIPSGPQPNVEETAAFSGTVVNNPDASVPSLESADTTDSRKQSESGPEPKVVQ